MLVRADQAEPKETRRWQAYFAAAGYPCFTLDSVSGAGYDTVLDRLKQLLDLKLRVGARKGIESATLRVAALGVPNVGKSTFLNRLLGRRRLKTGNRPGITRGRQWVRLFDDVEVLDTPGILRDPTGFAQRKPYWMLLNLMPYDPQIREQCVELLMHKLSQRAWGKLFKYYRVDADSSLSDWLELLQQIGRGRGFDARSDAGVDRAARTLLRDFQQGRFGRLSLQQAGQDKVTSPMFHAPDEAKNQ